MRILHVLDHSIPLHSGYAFRTLSILREQRALGWETAHITSAKHHLACPDVEDIDGLTFYRTQPSQALVKHLPLGDHLAVVEGLTRRLTALIPKLSPDIVHAHSPSLTGVAALRAARRFGIPVVYEVRALWEDGAVDHGTAPPGGWRYHLSRGLETWVLRNADAVTTICEGLRKEIVGRGVDAAKVTVIPNAVDPARFRASGVRNAELARRLGLDGARVIGFIGSFYGYEGLAVLLDAMPAMLARMPQLRLLLAGGGPEEEKLKRQVADLRIGDKVVFVGRVPHDQIQDYYNVVEALVYPRLRTRVTELVTPLKPLEAMAQGRAVVMSDVGGHRELVEDGQTGRMFPAEDRAALAEAILTLLSTPELASAMQLKARRFVETQRTWSASVGRYAAVYGDLLTYRRLGVVH